MFRGARSLMFLLAVASLLGPAASSASATPAADFNATFDRTGAAPTATAEAKNFPVGVSSTIRVVRGASELARGTTAAGNTRVSVTYADLQSGDVLELYRPALPAGPPAVGPISTYTIPPASMNLAAGATAISGSAPDGQTARISVDEVCRYNTIDSIGVAASGGAFSVGVPALAPGQEVSLHVFSGEGDHTQLLQNVPGETPCVYVNAVDGLDLVPPYYVGIDRLQGSVAPTARVVWSRGGTPISDVSGPIPEVFLPSATKPLAGDTIELYRPQAAPAPSAVYTIPAVSATLDTSVSRLAIDGPAAGFTRLFFAEANDLGPLGFRDLPSLAAGRTIVDTSTPTAGERPFTMTPTTVAQVNWANLDLSFQYGISAVQGDLAAPRVTITLAKKIKVGKIGKSVSIKIRPNETITGKARLTLPRSLPSRSNPRRKAGKKTFVFASANVAVGVGGKTFKLNLSKSGRKALKSLKSAGRRMIPVKATLTISATDAAGNASTTVKTARLVAR